MSEVDEQATNNEAESTERCCWVCYVTDTDDRTAAWVKPCLCRGTGKWVHQACLLRWVDEIQKCNTNRPVTCPLCRTEYLIVLPPVGYFVSLLDSLEEMTRKICPFIAGGFMVSSIYWTAITYGAVTVIQVAGQKEGLEMLEMADPLVMLILLPAIPVGLICAGTLKWEDAVLLALRKTCRKVPALGLVLPFGEGEDQSPFQPPQDSGIQTETQSILASRSSPTRIFCGALILPTISCIVGHILFSNVKNNGHRTFLGGLTFIAIKGILNIYHKQKMHIRRSKQKILDYPDPSMSLKEQIVTIFNR